MDITYRKAEADELALCADLLAGLYEAGRGELLGQLRKGLHAGNTAFFLALDGDRAIGCAHCTIRRDHVEGASGGPVGYLEGVYVLPKYRSAGVARALTGQGERWAADRGCREFGSHCNLTDEDSRAFHRSMGFREAGRSICFIKRLR